MFSSNTADSPPWGLETLANDDSVRVHVASAYKKKRCPVQTSISQPVNLISQIPYWKVVRYHEATSRAWTSLLKLISGCPESPKKRAFMFNITSLISKGHPGFSTRKQTHCIHDPRFKSSLRDPRYKHREAVVQYLRLETNQV